MITIIHKIRLKPNVDPRNFENWVKNTDYLAAPKFPSLISFGVRRISAHQKQPLYHYFEVIEITNLEQFEEEMKSADFQKLVAEFSKMAEVLEEIEGDVIEPGYRLPT